MSVSVPLPNEDPLSPRPNWKLVTLLLLYTPTTELASTLPRVRQVAEKARLRLSRAPGVGRGHESGCCGWVRQAGSRLQALGSMPRGGQPAAHQWRPLGGLAERSEARGSWQGRVVVRSGGRAKYRGGKANSWQRGWLQIRGGCK